MNSNENWLHYMIIILAWGLGGMEVVLILGVVVMLFGAKKIPELAKGLGTGIKEFKKAAREVTDEIQNTTTDTPPAAKLPPNGQSPSAPTVSQSSNSLKAWGRTFLAWP